MTYAISNLGEYQCQISLLSAMAEQSQHHLSRDNPISPTHPILRCIKATAMSALPMRLLWKIPVVGPLVFHIWTLDAQRKYDWLSEFLDPEGSILEIGSGPGSVLRVLRDHHHQVTPLDITDTSFDNKLRPVLYNGHTMPFADNSFDTALLLTTLHHTPDPDHILSETMRVARQVIIIEDIYHTPLHRKLTKMADSITNLEFFGHPHSNRNDIGWRATFERLGLELIHTSQKPMAGYFLQALYVLAKTNTAKDAITGQQAA